MNYKFISFRHRTTENNSKGKENKDKLSIKQRWIERKMQTDRKTNRQKKQTNRYRIEDIHITYKTDGYYKKRGGKEITLP